ncbi:MAG TPA: HlyD family efflux transporter periplasmic adaptor subunit [Crenotrichaceae bacterium]|nr:HlyD family efflux transporter periplasmic adaptor subunit [Crenotrichaceae bacterium]
MQFLYRYFFITVAVVGLFSHTLYADIINLSAEQQQRLGIRTEQVAVSNQSTYLNLPARVVVPPDQTYIVSAAQAGIVRQVFVGEGDSVVHQQRLLAMSSPELLGLQQAFLEAHTQLKLAQNQQQRLQALWEEGVISERRWLELKSAVQLAQSVVSEKQSLLSLAGLSKKQINSLRIHHRLNQSLNVFAPGEGVIMQRLVVPGQRVEIMTPLFHLADLSSLWLEIPVPVQHIASVKNADHVEIQDSDVSARIILRSRKVDAENQTVLVRALIHQPPPDVRVDQLVNVVFVRATTTPQYQLPISAVVRQNGQTYVFVSIENGFEARRVKLANSGQAFALVKSGLSADEYIAVKGVAALKAVWQTIEESTGDNH